jgi:hypothetical protein
MSEIMHFNSKHDGNTTDEKKITLPDDTIIYQVQRKSVLMWSKGLVSDLTEKSILNTMLHLRLQVANKCVQPSNF